MKLHEDYIAFLTKSITSKRSRAEIFNTSNTRQVFETGKGRGRGRGRGGIRDHYSGRGDNSNTTNYQISGLKIEEKFLESTKSYSSEAYQSLLRQKNTVLWNEKQKLKKNTDS